MVLRPTGWFDMPNSSTGFRNVKINYEYGADEPDAELKEAALGAIKHKLLGDRSGIPDRAVAMTTEAGGFTLGIAGPASPTGLPAVDSVLNGYRMPVVG